MNTSLPPSRPLTTRAQRVMALADKAAAELEHQAIGTEHLLLGLLSEKTGIAAQILDQLGVTADFVHQELRRAQGLPG